MTPRSHAPKRSRPHRPFQPSAFLTVLLVLSGISLPMETAVSEETESARDERTWYAVEVIVFRQWELGGSDAERWPSRVAEPWYALWQKPQGCTDDPRRPVLDGAEAPDAAGEASEDRERPGEDPAGGDVFRCLDPEDRQLTPKWNELRGSGDYRPLYHLAWIQPGYARSESVAVPVPMYWQPLTGREATGVEAAGPRLNPTVYGLLRIYRERFLHAVVDLRFQRFGSGQDVDVDERLRAPVHALRDARRMRSGELHYIDHPAMGVLIEIREHDPDDAES